MSDIKKVLDTYQFFRDFDVDGYVSTANYLYINIVLYRSGDKEIRLRRDRKIKPRGGKEKSEEELLTNRKVRLKLIINSSRDLMKFYEKIELPSVKDSSLDSSLIAFVLGKEEVSKFQDKFREFFKSKPEVMGEMELYANKIKFLGHALKNQKEALENILQAYHEGPSEKSEKEKP